MLLSALLRVITLLPLLIRAIPLDAQAPTDPQATDPQAPADPQATTGPQAPTDPQLPADPQTPADPLAPSDPPASNDPPVATDPHTLPLETVTDPCADISGLKYVAPALVRACFSSFPFNATLRDNIVDVVNKTLNFHTSTTYQVQAMDPFTDTAVDIKAELARIKESTYASDFELHQDLGRQLKRLHDGHAPYLNYCYDSSYVTYLPFPLVPLSDPNALDVQAIYIAPEAFDVASDEFSDYINQWQASSLLKFKIYSGAKVISINGQDPWAAVDENAEVTGGYQAKATRQNSFFATYVRRAQAFGYRLGDFASLSLPMKDTVSLVLLRVNQTDPVSIEVPYISRLGATTRPFNNAETYWKANCAANVNTNGVNFYRSNAQAKRFEVSSSSRRFDLPEDTDPKQKISYFIDEGMIYDIPLPARLNPNLQIVSGGGQAIFYFIPEKKTGVLALGSFSGTRFAEFFGVLKDGIQRLVDLGATHFIIDVSNNGGGYICLAHYLHRLLSGPDPGIDLQAGLDTKARSNPLAQTIVKKIISSPPTFDPFNFLLYKPSNWKGADSLRYFSRDYDWLDPDVKETINGRPDAFSQRLGDECHPFPLPPFTFQPFPFDNIAILSNTRCASSCALFSLTMKAKHATKIVAVGGKQGVTQEYCGVIGGQSLSFTALDSEIKTVHLKNHTDAPPDFLTDSYQGLTWRLAYGLTGDLPEEWNTHPAQFTLPLTTNNVNNPQVLWNDMIKSLWPDL